jgi:3,4-dihydroxy 2-butanone 4-phosphate synthase/GTP cyclohydrolase II
MSRFERVERAIAAIRRGEMVVMVDDEDRENEGDLVIAAEHCDAKAVNFMCREGRGLICLSLTTERVQQLGLPMMVPTDQTSMGTAFTISIEAKEGVTTGISAADRATTVRVAADPKFGAADIVSPGHIFPLRAKRGGVLVRSGHTEGSVDISRLAGCNAAAVICEIMRDDGEMARMDDLEVFAETHGLCIVTIADLIEYRLQRESLVEEVGAKPFASETLGVSADSDWQIRVFNSVVEPKATFVVLTLGDVDDESKGPVLLRAQRAQVLGDVFGFAGNGGGDSASRIRGALRRIEGEGRGVFLYVVGQGFETIDANLGSVTAKSPGLRPNESGFRDFGLGAQVLKTLGVDSIEVLTDNPRKIVGLEGFGIEVKGTRPLSGQG